MRDQAGAATGTAWPKTTDPTDRPLPGMPPRGQFTAARTGQLTGPQTPFHLDDIATYHDHGCLRCTKHRPSRPAKEWGGPLRFQNVIRLSSHTNKGPPAGSP